MTKQATIVVTGALRVKFLSNISFLVLPKKVLMHLRFYIACNLSVFVEVEL